MNASKMNVLLAATLTALAEGNGETREGILYGALMGQCTLDEFQAMLYVAEKGRILKRGPNFLLTITGRGREIAEKIEAQIAEAKRKKMALVPSPRGWDSAA